jgi:hypothetical protein
MLTIWPKRIGKKVPKRAKSLINEPISRSEPPMIRQHFTPYYSMTLTDMKLAGKYRTR